MQGTYSKGAKGGTTSSIRVVTEQAAAAPTQSSPHNANTTATQFEVIDSPHHPMHSPSAIPIILQDDNSSPAHNTRHQRQVRTLTQDYMLHMMEIPGYKAPFTPSQAAARKYPLQFLCNFAYTVLDDNTGELLEYRHLI